MFRSSALVSRLSAATTSFLTLVTCISMLSGIVRNKKSVQMISQNISESLLFIIEESKKMSDPVVGLYAGVVKKFVIK